MDVSHLVAQGKQLIEERNWQAALAVWDRVCQASPPGVDHFFSRGRCHLGLGQWEQAAADFRRVLAGQPGNAAAAFNVGYALYNLERYEEAVPLLEQYLAHDPKDAETYFYRGRCMQLTRRWRAAIADYDRVSELAPDDANHYYNRGMCRAEIGSYAEAVADYDRYLQLRPPHEQGFNNLFWYNRAIARTGLADHRGAIEDYDRFLEISPEDADTFHNRGLRRLDLGDYRRAWEDLERAVALDPKKGDALAAIIVYTKEARAFEQKGGVPYAEHLCKRGWQKIGWSEYATALLWFNRAIDAAGKHAEAWHGRGMAKFNQSQFQDAIQDLSRAIELGGTNTELAARFRDRARARRNAGDTKAAIADYDRSVELNPEDADAWGWRGYAKQILEDWDGSAADFGRALALDPKRQQDWVNRGFSHRRAGRNREAIADYSRALELDPNDAIAWGNRGVAKGDVDDPHGALADIKKAIELGSENSEGLKDLIPGLEERAKTARPKPARAATPPPRPQTPPPPLILARRPPEAWAAPAGHAGPGVIVVSEGGKTRVQRLAGEVSVAGARLALRGGVWTVAPDAKAQVRVNGAALRRPLVVASGDRIAAGEVSATFYASADPELPLGAAANGFSHARHRIAEAVALTDAKDRAFLERLADLEQAIVENDRFVVLQPAIAEMNAKNWAGALAILDAALSVQPDHPGLLFHKALCLANLDRFDEAGPVAHRARDHAGDDEETWSEATALIRQIREIGPKLALQPAIERMNDDDFAGAIPIIEAALRAYSESATLYFHLGICYGRTKQYQKARSALGNAKKHAEDAELRESVEKLRAQVDEAEEEEKAGPIIDRAIASFKAGAYTAAVAAFGELPERVRELPNIKFMWCAARARAFANRERIGVGGGGLQFNPRGREWSDPIQLLAALDSKEKIIKALHDVINRTEDADLKGQAQSLIDQVRYLV